jgi:hypothetical protein
LSWFESWLFFRHSIAGSCESDVNAQFITALHGLAQSRRVPSGQLC